MITYTPFPDIVFIHIYTTDEGVGKLGDGAF